MDTYEQKLMSAQDFEKKISEWAKKVQRSSRSLLRQTKGEGNLGKTMNFRLRYDNSKIWLEAVGFQFNRYGAFREYGAGRGYIVKDGVIRRGARLWNIRKKKFLSTEIAGKMKAEGYSMGELKNYKMIDDNQDSIKRSPLPWLDKPLTENISELGDIAAEFYGDHALQTVLNQLNNVTIKKNYGGK